MKICVRFEAREFTVDVDSGTTFRDLYTRMNQNLFCYSVEDLHDMFSSTYPNIDATLSSANVEDNQEFIIKTFY